MTPLLAEQNSGNLRHQRHLRAILLDLAKGRGALYDSRMTPLYREVQRYRDLPPFTVLVVAGTLLGWFLVVWAGVLGRPIGRAAAPLPLPVALAIGLPLGILLPLAYTRLEMTTEVFVDRVVVRNGMSSNVTVPYEQVAAITLRTDDIRGDYNQRNIGAVSNTRTAYVVEASQGVQLELRDGRLILIGSKAPQALAAALEAACGVPLAAPS